MALGVLAAVRKLGASLPPQGVEPVAFRLRLLFVGSAVLLEHQLVESLLHGVLAIGEAVGVVQAVHEGLKELLVHRAKGGGIGERNDCDGIELHVTFLFNFSLVICDQSFWGHFSMPRITPHLQTYGIREFTF